MLLLTIESDGVSCRWDFQDSARDGETSLGCVEIVVREDGVILEPLLAESDTLGERMELRLLPWMTEEMARLLPAEGGGASVTDKRIDADWH